MPVFMGVQRCGHTGASFGQQADCLHSSSGGAILLDADRGGAYPDLAQLVLLTVLARLKDLRITVLMHSGEKLG